MALGAAVARGLRVILLVCGIGVAAVLGLKVAALALEPRIAFHPVGPYALTPRAAGVPYEDVVIRADDGVRLHGWFVTTGSQGRAPAILFFHGNAENISGGLALAALARAAGFATLLVDYRGYGESEGRPSQEGLGRDGRAAIGWLRARHDVDRSRLVVWGRSLGSWVALSAAAATAEGVADGPAGVILESPFTSVADLLREGNHTVLRIVSRFGAYRFDNTALIRRVPAPILVIHGTDDEVVPFVLGRRLSEMVPGRARLAAIPGGGHNDLWTAHADEVWDVARRFLETIRTGGGAG